MIGLETSASWKTSSSARSSCATGRRSAWKTAAGSPSSRRSFEAWCCAVASPESTEKPAAVVVAEGFDETDDEEYVAFECQRLLDSLREARGNKSKAARLLMLPRSTFCSKLAKHGLIAPGDVELETLQNRRDGQSSRVTVQVFLIVEER